MVITRALYISTQSTSCVPLADDCFVGSKYLEVYADMTQNIRQICPQSLSLFELVVLADAIHNYDPQYTVLKRQCFWFATTLCDVVIGEYDCITVTGSAPSVSRDEVCNRYLPNEEGRWMGMKVCQPEDRETSVIASNFQKYLQEKENEVHFIFYP